jgi:GNAT superfamily N-acetyltransferase
VITLTPNFEGQIWYNSIAPHPAWRLKPVTPDDFSVVKTLFKKLHSFNAALDPLFALSDEDEWESHLDVYLQHALSCEKCLCLVAYSLADKRPAGFVLASVQQESAMWKHRAWVEIVALYVEPHWRGQGLAEQLLEPVYHWTSGLGIERVQLYVTASNESAQRFYARQDFRPVQAILRKQLPSNE